MDHLRKRIDAGEVSALYVYSLSRLARSNQELLALAESCAATGMVIRVTKEGTLDWSSPDDRLYLTALVAVATFKAEVASAALAVGPLVESLTKPASYVVATAAGVPSEAVASRLLDLCKPPSVDRLVRSRSA